MTEEGAKTKYCPYMSTGSTTVSSTISTNPAWAYCVASSCMMWVWNENAFNAFNVSLDTTEEEAKEMIQKCEFKMDGYCGLAK